MQAKYIIEMLQSLPPDIEIKGEISYSYIGFDWKENFDDNDGKLIQKNHHGIYEEIDTISNALKRVKTNNGVNADQKGMAAS